MKDIHSKLDLERLLYNFYSVVTKDELIGHHFDDINFESHIPVFVDFWSKTLFDKPGYYGNPLVVHQNLDRKSKLQKAHFERWLEIFNATVDELYSGENAEKAKTRAAFIGQTLSERLNPERDPEGV